jgi:hypothetical protein
MDFNSLSSLIPAEITIGSMIKFILFLVCIAMGVGLLFRLLLGKESAINKAICAAIGVLCIYTLTVVVYTFSPGNLEEFLVPLPFVQFSEENLYLMSFRNTDFTVICSQVLSMVILVLLYNLTDSILPDGENATAVSWLALRFVTIVAAMFIHWFVTGITSSFLPNLLVSHGPMILLLCLVSSMLLGVLKVALSLVLTVINPIIGLLFTFFFTNKIGKEISKAMLTTTLLSLLTILLSHLGYSVICISAAALTSYIPLLAVLLGLWLVIGRKL